MASSPPRGSPLLEVVRVFLKLGVLGFGGPAAHVAMMEDEVVRRRRWLGRERFLDLLGATNLIPGPNSTEMAIHLGRLRAGWPGLVAGGAAFIVPAFVLVLGCAWAYVRYHSLPAVGGLLYGVEPVIVAIVAQALWGFGRAAVKSGWLAGLGVAAAAATVAGVHELAVLFAAGALCAVAVWVWTERGRGGAAGLAALAALAPAARRVAASPGAVASGGVAAVAAASATPFGLLPLFLFFLKVGAVLFGSGYVLLAFLRADLVARWGWLTEGQLLDAVAVGQVTPGPVFTTATFIGYLLGGLPGAVLATIGIFLPAFVFVALSGPLVPRLRRSRVAGAFLDGVNVASIALMAVVTAQLARAALVDATTLGLALVSAALLFRFRVASPWLVLGGGLIGLALRH